MYPFPTGDQLPKSLEGFFIYEEEGSGVPGSNRRGNDAIVVEQWTVIEVSCRFQQSAFLLCVDHVVEKFCKFLKYRKKKIQGRIVFSRLAR